jgi:hypothetical protein
MQCECMKQLEGMERDAGPQGTGIGNQVKPRTGSKGKITE